jgi:hypothetical protein
MNVLIPLGIGSAWNDNELRFCLRGIEKRLKGYGDIVIVGQCPDWLTGVIHIPAEDKWQAHYRDYNIYNKIRIAIEDGRVGSEFLFFNDDHFLLHDFEASSFPYHYSQSLHKCSERIKNVSFYRHVLTNTLNLLVSRNCPDKHFDIHAPIIYKSDLFLQHVSSADWKKPYGYAIKSLYCNLVGIEGEEYEDVKINEPLSAGEIYKVLQDRFYFSIGNKSLNADMKDVLHQLYPVPSRYEK